VDSALEIHANGTLVYGTTLRRKRDDPLSIVAGFVIDEDETERRLAAFAHYANLFYRSLERGDVITGLYLGTSMTGIQMKSFGRIQTSPSNGVAVPMHGLADPLKIPSVPLRISRAELAEPATLAKKATGHIARAFRTANVYYNS